MSHFPLDPDLASLSAALGGLAPTPAIIDRDRLLFEAGRRSVRRPWPIVAGVFAVLSIGLSARLMTVSPRVQVVYVTKASEKPALASRERQRPEPVSQNQTPVADVPGSPLDPPRAAGAAYLRLRDQVVRFGADSLPNIVAAPAGPQPPVEKMLGLPTGTLSDTQKSRWEHQLYQGGA